MRHSGSCYPATRIGRAELGPPGDMAGLLEQLLAAGAGDGFQALLDRDPGGQALPGTTCGTWPACSRRCVRPATTTRPARWPPGPSETPRRSGLAHPGAAAALLLAVLCRADHEAAGAAGPDPARQARLDRPRDVARLLAGCAPPAPGGGRGPGPAGGWGGKFGLFLADRSDEAVRPGGSDPDRAVSYRYGCEQELAPAPPWRWAPPDSGAAGSGPAREISGCGWKGAY